MHTLHTYRQCCKVLTCAIPHPSSNDMHAPWLNLQDFYMWYVRRGISLECHIYVHVAKNPFLNIALYIPWHVTIVYGPQGKVPYYPFPHLRVKLQRDPKDRSVSGKVPQFTTFHSIAITSACYCMCINMNSERHASKANVRLTVMHELDLIDPIAY